MAKRVKVQSNLSYSIEIIGARPPGPADAFHAMLRMAWWRALGVIAGGYVVINVIFALIYLNIGGLENATPGSFGDAFFFSVQTFGTIGYGVVHPVSTVANVVVVVESVTALITTALATGVIVVRFTLTKARMVFSEKIAVSPIDGVPTLQMRIGNDRSNQIYDAHMRLTLSRTSRTKEGQTYFRSVDLPLVRDRASALARSWNLLHRIDASSPLYGETPESLKASEAEISVSVSGIDDTSMQSVHARRVYEDSSIVWGVRLADVLSTTEDGDLRLDLRRFHEVVPTEPIEGFPYPAKT
jgi:inward rectifier potassium channel